MYASPEDLRAEGVRPDLVDERLEALLDEATRTIDHLTGWFFEPRVRAYEVDGRGTPTIEPPAPPIAIDRIEVNDRAIDLRDLLIVGAPVRPEFSSPRITYRNGCRFPRGNGNVQIEGLFGFTEEDGTATGRTPLAIRRATMLLALRNLGPLADDESYELRNRWRVLSERTRDQGYTLDRLERATPALTGDPEVDEILWAYRRPRRMAAA